MEINKIINALDDKTRLEMVFILSEHKYCQVHLEKLTNISQTNISRKLKVLQDAKIIKCVPTKKKNRYFVTEEFKTSFPDLYQSIQKHFENSELTHKLTTIENECEVYNNEKDNH